MLGSPEGEGKRGHIHIECGIRRGEGETSGGGGGFLGFATVVEPQI